MNAGARAPVCYNRRRVARRGRAGGPGGRAPETMRRPAGFWLALAITAILLGAAVEAAVRLVDVRATLRGEVVADGLARVGDQVSEGDPLVYVRTQIGRAPAARAPVDGRVAEVLVSPGTEIRELGAVVARLEPR